MDRKLFCTTAMVGLVLSIGVTAAHAGHHQGSAGVIYRPVMGMHAGWGHPGFGGFHGYRHLPPVSGVIRTQPMGYGAGYGGAPYGQGPAIYAVPHRGYATRRPAYGTGYGQAPGYATAPAYAPAPGYGQGPGYGGGYAYSGGRAQVAPMRLANREAFRHRGGYGYGHGYGYGNGNGNGYGYGPAAALGAAVGGVVGYAVGGATGGYEGYPADNTGDIDTGYPAPETPLTVHYGEPEMQPSAGLFGTGGYAVDGQIQDAGYGGPTVAGYGFGGTTGWAPAVRPAGGLAVYSPGAYGPGPRVITIPSQYRTGGCTCSAAPGY